MSSDLPRIDPMPPRARSWLPFVGAGAGLLRDPTSFFHACRRSLGDTFAVDAFGYRLLCVFSPRGVESLWSLPEREASKGLADFALLSHKVPALLFAGRRTFPAELFGRDDVDAYLDNLRQAIETLLAELGPSGELEIFEFTRGLAHRVGLASWGGIGTAAPEIHARLAVHFDRLDLSESFVHPASAFRTVVTRKRAERRALLEIEQIFAGLLAGRPAPRPDSPDLFDRICNAWAAEPSPEREQGIARDVVLVHMGSQSNLFAAMGWTLVHLLERPDWIERIRAGDDDLLDRCGLEAVRLRQRSIVLRRVLKPVVLEDEQHAYRVLPGTFIATMMSVTNTTAAAGLDRFDPDHFVGSRGPRFARAAELAVPELVTTYGHGRHSCPARRFSTAAIRLSLRALFERYDLEPRYRDPRPLRRQIGGVARADRPCRVRYSARAVRR